MSWMWKTVASCRRPLCEHWDRDISPAKNWAVMEEDLSRLMVCNRALEGLSTCARRRMKAGTCRALKAAYLASKLCIVVGRLACSKLSATTGEPEAQEVSSLMRP